MNGRKQHRHQHEHAHAHDHAHEAGDHDRKHLMGKGGACICPKCGERTWHRGGIPCQEEACPKCGAKMLREGSPHHELYVKKHAEE